MRDVRTDGDPVLNVLPPPVKPRLRGVLHQWAFLASIPLGLTLVAVASTTSAKVAALVYSLGACALYGTSAAYHRGHWSDRGRHGSWRNRRPIDRSGERRCFNRGSGLGSGRSNPIPLPVRRF